MINNIANKKSNITDRLKLFLILFLIPVWCIANTSALQQNFLNTEKQIKQRKIKNVSQIPNSLRNYSLFPYLELNLISSKLNANPIFEINDFYNKYNDEPVTKKLNYYWIMYLAKHNRWQDILKYYKPNNSTKLQCLYTAAKQKIEPENVTKEEISDLWLYGHSRPEQCDELFTTWLNNKIVSKEMIWKRIFIAMENDNSELVKYLGKYLSELEYTDIMLWYRVHKSPNLIKSTKLFKKNNPFHHRILIHGLQKQAVENIDKSLRYYRELDSYFKFSKANKYKYYKYLAVRMYLRDHKDTENIIKQIPNKYYDEDFYEIAIKSALKNQNWNLIIERIEKLPTKLKNEDIWVYWKARAFDEIKQSNIAKQLYRTITNKTNYYGFLACNNLNQFCPIEFTITKPFQADKKKLLKNSNIARAIELYKLKRLHEARLEWNYAVKKLDEKQKFIAANIADELNWHDRSIVTVALYDKAKNDKKDSNNKSEKSDKSLEDSDYNLLHLKYPLGYENIIDRISKKYKVDPALIYAISRQESSFTHDAKSSAGAMGVMQLMPTTARRVAQDYNIPYSNKWNLLKENTNIRLGSAYLQKMLNNHNGNPVLAAAAYNAGPDRVKKWTKDINNTIATDIWIELVPFKETRNYLKTIVTNTAIYRSRLGKPPMLLDDIIPASIEAIN